MSPKLDIAAVALDLGNVLVKVDHFRFCRRLADLAGLTPEKVFAGIFQSSLEPGYDTGRLSDDEFHRRVMDHFGVSLPFYRFAAWWNDIFDPMEDMAEVVQRLAGRYPLYLVSNTNGLHFRHIRENYAFLQRFRRYILSYEVGSRKPEPGIYQALLREAAVPPSRCLFVDDKEPFVAAARNVGLVAWQFTTPRDFVGELQRHGLW